MTLLNITFCHLFDLLDHQRSPLSKFLIFGPIRRHLPLILIQNQKGGGQTQDSCNQDSLLKNPKSNCLREILKDKKICSRPTLKLILLPNQHNQTKDRNSFN